MEIFCKYSELVDPKELLDHPNNPNKHPDSQVQVLCESIKSYGWRHPIVVSNLTKRIVAGHCRKQAAIELGVDVPVDYQDFKSETDELAVLIADNVIPELAEMDQLLLQENVDELSGLGIEIESLGILEEILSTKKEVVKTNDDPFFISHILISFPVEKFTEIQDSLEKLYEIDGINIEQSSS